MSATPQQDNPPPAGKPPTSGLAVAGLVTTILCLQPIGFLLSLIALIRILSSKGRLGGQVIAIIALVLTIPMCGVSMAIAVPNFVRFQCRAKQGEAKANLKVLYVAQESFKIEKNAYTADLAQLNFAPVGARYTFAILQAGPSTFRAEARGTGDMEGDVWEIDQARDPRATTDKCR